VRVVCSCSLQRYGDLSIYIVWWLHSELKKGDFFYHSRFLLEYYLPLYALCISLEKINNRAEFFFARLCRCLRVASPQLHMQQFRSVYVVAFSPTMGC
jgi:hypothetical protein